MFYLNAIKYVPFHRPLPKTPQILCILPQLIADTRKRFGFRYLLDARRMRGFVGALKRRQTRYVCETGKSLLPHGNMNSQP